MKSKFKIEGLDCANCTNELERKIGKIEGIENVSINFLMQKMEIEYNEQDREEILQKVRKVIKKEEPYVNIKEI